MSAHLQIFAAVARGPLLWLPCTLGLYAAATAVYRRAGKTPVLNPTLLTIAAVGILLTAAGVSCDHYLEGVAILNHVLGTAVVALAIPLHRHLHLLRGRSRSLAMALVAGSATSLMVGVLVAQLGGASHETLLSIAPKSTTAAVSIEVSRTIGGIPALTAGLTIMTGILTAIVGPYVLDLLRVRSPEGRGLALGVAGHGIATARAFSESEATGTFASIGMALNAPLTAVLVPLLLWSLGLL